MVFVKCPSVQSARSANKMFTVNGQTPVLKVIFYIPTSTLNKWP